jgi:AcrR family transcriptional regulator
MTKLRKSDRKARRRNKPANQRRQITGEDDDHLQRLIIKAREKFATLGFNKTTMDEIAGELGMSKKTLYKLFPTKAKLMEGVLEHTFAELNRRCDAILEDRQPAVEKLVSLVRMIAEQQRGFATKAMVESLHNHLPHLWQRVEAFRRERMRKNLQVIVKQGVSEGTVSGAFNREMFFHFLLGAVHEGISPEVLVNASYSLGEALAGLIGIFMNGVLTGSGRKQYQKLMNAKGA